MVFALYMGIWNQDGGPMTASITNLPNYNGYYQLSKQSGGNVGQSNTAGGGLLRALSPSANTLSASNAAYFLDLSPEARQYLEGINNGTISAAPASNNHNGFWLTQEQQKQITGILLQYRDAPFDQDSFNAIQNDLDAAGLGPEKLAMLESARIYNPTMVLIKSLNGDDTPSPETTGVMSDEEKQAKTDVYMQQIVSEWKQLREQQPQDDSADGEDTQGVSATGSAGGA